jgi:hypothetical protein
MADVGLGQVATLTGRARSRVLKDAISDNHPLTKAMKDHSGIKRKDGGRTIVEEGMTAQNSTVAWIGPSGAVDLTDAKVIDAAEYDWSYIMGSVVWTLAEQLQNMGGRDTKYIDLVPSKFRVLEASIQNVFHAGMLSSGTGSGGLQMPGLGALLSTSPSSGTVGGIDRSASAAAWFRNQAFTSTTAVSSATTDASNIKRFLDYGLDACIRNSQIQTTLMFMGSSHWERLNQALQAIQIIQNVSGTARGGFDRLVYRGVPAYFGGGVNYSGESALTATYTYFICTKPGGVNLWFHRKAEFDMLEPVNSEDQAAVRRLNFTMACMTVGALAKLNAIGYDG